MFSDTKAKGFSPEPPERGLSPSCCTQCSFAGFWYYMYVTGRQSCIWAPVFPWLFIGPGLTSSESALTTHPKYLTLWVRTLRLTPCILCTLHGGLWRAVLEFSMVLSARELDGCLLSEIRWDLLGVWKLFSQIINVYIFISFSSWNKFDIETLCPLLCLRTCVWGLLGKDIGSRTFWTAVLYSMGQCQGYVPPSFSWLLFLLTLV